MLSFASPGGLRFIALAATLALAGCHDAQRAITDAGIEAGRAGTPRVDREHAGSVAGNRTHAGSTLIVPTEALLLPVDFPADVFVPGGYRVNSVMDTGPMQVISLQADGRVSALFANARSTMQAHGWIQTMAMQSSADSAMLSYEKDSRAAVLSFNQAARGVTMSVQVRRARQ